MTILLLRNGEQLADLDLMEWYEQFTIFAPELLSHGTTFCRTPKQTLRMALAATLRRFDEPDQPDAELVITNQVDQPFGIAVEQQLRGLGPLPAHEWMALAEALRRFPDPKLVITNQES